MWRGGFSQEGEDRLHTGQNIWARSWGKKGILGGRDRPMEDRALGVGSGKVTCPSQAQRRLTCSSVEERGSCSSGLRSPGKALLLGSSSQAPWSFGMCELPASSTVASFCLKSSSES